MSGDTVCRVCLVNDLKLYEVRIELQNVYERITRQKYDKVGYPVRMCYICLSVLRKCHRFMETARDADRFLTQWHKQTNEMGLAKPLSTYSLTKVTLVEIGNAHISLKHEIKTENIDYAEQEVVDEQTENIEFIYNVDIKKLDIDEPTDYSSMFVDSSTDTVHNENIQARDDKQTYPFFNTNMGNEWSGSDMVSQHHNDNSQICEITKVKSEIDDLHTEIEIDETPEGDADDVCHTENVNIKFNPKPKILNTKGKPKKLDQKSKTFSCSVCGYKCTRESHLTRHMRTHTGEKPFSCDICDYKCTRKSNLTCHKRTHTGEKTFSCDICDYKSTQKANLTLHKKTHTGAKPFACDICDYKSTQKSTLTLHKRSHTGEKPFSCELCDYKCTGKSNLNRHITIHTREKSISCDIWNSKSTQKSNLTLNKQTHTGAKLFVCDICDYKCIRKQSLADHIKTHTGEKPFCCYICGYKCTRKTNLNKHLIHKHRSNKWK